VLVARKVGYELKLVGNQARYAASVSPIAQRRDFVNSPDHSFIGTGYHLTVANRVDAQGDPSSTRSW
jgi:hypothetical protein